MKATGLLKLCLLTAITLPWWVALSHAQVPALPFKVNADGTIDERELLKLTKIPTARDRITDAELEAIKAAHQIDYGPGFTPTDQPEMPPRVDLYAESALLSDGVNHTLIPTDALIWVPDSLKERVVDAPVGKLILWPYFLKQQSHWLRSEELSLETSEGLIPISDEKWKVIRSPNHVVVSVHQGNPISLILPPEPKDPGLMTQSAESGANLSEVVGPNAPSGSSEDSGTASAETASKKPAVTDQRPNRFDVSNRFRGRNTN